MSGREAIIRGLGQSKVPPCRNLNQTVIGVVCGVEFQVGIKCLSSFQNSNAKLLPSYFELFEVEG